MIEGGHGLAAVVDGMGGLPFAYETAKLCNQTILSFAGVEADPRAIVASANDAVMAEYGANVVGAAIVVLTFSADAIRCAWLGDVRLYARRGPARTLTAMTKDHSRLAVRLERNPSGDEVRDSKADAQNLTRSLGESKLVDPASYLDLTGHREFVLASDGAWSGPLDLMRGALLNPVVDDDATVLRLRLSTDFDDGQLERLERVAIDL